MRWNVKVIENTSLLPAMIISIECLVACNRVNYVGGTEDCERFVSVANTLHPVAKGLIHFKRFWKIPSSSREIPFLVVVYLEKTMRFG